MSPPGGEKVQGKLSAVAGRDVDRVPSIQVEPSARRYATMDASREALDRWPGQPIRLPHGMAELIHVDGETPQPPGIESDRQRVAEGAERHCPIPEELSRPAIDRAQRQPLLEDAHRQEMLRESGFERFELDPIETADGMEISPVYVDVAVLRWQQATGQQAVLEDDGRSFDELAAERLPAAA